MSGFVQQSPTQKAQCRVCRGGIEAGDPAIHLETYAAGKWLSLYFHIYCFPEKKDIVSNDH